MSNAKDSIGPIDILLDESTVSIKLGKESHEVRRMTMGDLAALQNRLKKQFNRPLTPEEIFNELATPEGVTFILWRRLQDAGSRLTLEAVQDNIPANADALMMLMQTLGLEPGEGSGSGPF